MINSTRSKNKGELVLILKSYVFSKWYIFVREKGFVWFIMIRKNSEKVNGYFGADFKF